MSSEWELDEGIKSIKSAWQREHTARANFEKMLEQAEAENAKLRELAKDACTVLKNHYNHEWFDGTVFAERMHELGIEVK